MKRKRIDILKSFYEREALEAGTDREDLSVVEKFALLKSQECLEEVQTAKGKQKKAAIALPPELTWWCLTGTEAPTSINPKSNSAYGFKPTRYASLLEKTLRERLSRESYEAYEEVFLSLHVDSRRRRSGLNRGLNLAKKIGPRLRRYTRRLIEMRSQATPVLNLAILFGKEDVVDKYRQGRALLEATKVVRQCYPDTVEGTPHWKKAVTRQAKQQYQMLNYHDLGQFSLPTSGAWNIEGWRKFVLKFPQAIRWAAFFALVEKGLGSRQIHTLSLKEFKTLVAQFSYKGVETERDKELAILCLKHGVEQEYFTKYKKILASSKVAEAIPHVHIEEGEHTFRKLDCQDVRGPMLGLITDCCQHLDGAAYSCAIAGTLSTWSGFYVVEKRGEIIACSWAWRGRFSELVFDSIEILGNQDTDIIKKLYQKAANMLVGQLGVKEVLVGLCHDMFEEVSAYPADMVDEVGYTDAGTQYIVKKSICEECDKQHYECCHICDWDIPSTNYKEFLDDEGEGQEWLCDQCGAVVEEDATECWDCGALI